MGSSTSKPTGDPAMDRQNNFRRSLKNRKSSKANQIHSISLMVQNLKGEIDNFHGSRTSDRYKGFQEILTDSSKKIQLIKSKAKKQEQLDLCDETLGEIQNCFQRLETRVNFNENNDHSLDMAAVESHSFINHNFTNQRPPPPALLNEQWAQNLPPPTKLKQPQFESIRSVDRLEQQTQDLEQEIKRCIHLEDYKQFTILQKKIEILYTDLEMLNAAEHTPLGEKKTELGRRLIKCNNQIKKARKSLESKVTEYSTKQDGPAFSKPSKSDVDNTPEQDDWPEDFSKTEAKLEELEIRALTFEGYKSDRKYKELEQILESYWTKIYTVDTFGDKDRHRRETIIERIKNTLQELSKRAEENEKQDAAINNLGKINGEVRGWRKKSEEFKGTSKDPDFRKVDQSLRSLWANITKVDEPNEHVRRSKAKVINEIQDVLKRFSQSTKEREDIIYANTIALQQGDVGLPNPEEAIEEDILQSQLLHQVNAFHNHWNQLNYNLDVQKINKSEVSKAIVDVFDKIIEGINKKRNALVIIEKRKSTGSLVVAKVIDNTDMLMKITSMDSRSVQDLTSPPVTERYQSVSNPTLNYQAYHSTPDLLQQQYVTSPIPKPMETEIKVQPTVKTIGEIQRVASEAKTLLQQIRQSNCVKHDAEYVRFYNKLEQCRKTLESIPFNKKSETIESNRRRAHRTVGEALRVLEEKGTKSPNEQQNAAAIRSSKAQEVMDIDAELQYFRQQIKTFTGVTKDKQYEKIKQGLSDCLTKLQLLDDMHMNKQDSIRHIQQYHQELETKLAENQAKVRVTEQNAILKRQVSQDLRGVIEQVQRLKGQVERFSGVYDGLYYKQIGEQLNGCTQTLDRIDTKADPKLEGIKQQTKEKIRKYLMVLEDKSTKSSTPVENEKDEDVKQERQPQTADSVQNVQLSQARKSQLLDPSTPHFKINALRDKLVDIKGKTEIFGGSYKDEDYQKIEMDMINCLEELKFIDDHGHRSVILTKQQYEDYIDKLLHYFEEKSKLNDSEAETPAREAEVQQYPIQAKQAMQTFKVVDPTEELTSIETKINELKSKINSSEENLDDEAYKDMQQAIELQTAKLNQVDAGNVAHVREIKKRLAQELVNCSKLLNERAIKEKSPQIQKQFDRIDGILKEVNEISKEVATFVGAKDDKQFCCLDEELIKLMIQLDNTQTFGDTDLKDARKRAIQLIQGTMKILSDRAKQVEDAADEGATVV